MVVDWTGVGSGKLYGGVERKARTDGLRGGRIDANKSFLTLDEAPLTGEGADVDDEFLGVMEDVDSTTVWYRFRLRQVGFASS